MCQKVSRPKRNGKLNKGFKRNENVSVYVKILVVKAFILMLVTIATPNVHLRHFLGWGLGGLRGRRHHAGRVWRRVWGDRHQGLEPTVLCFRMEVAGGHSAKVAVLVTCNIWEYKDIRNDSHKRKSLTNIFSDQKPLASSSIVVTIRKTVSGSRSRWLTAWTPCASASPCSAGSLWTSASLWSPPSSATTTWSPWRLPAPAWGIPSFPQYSGFLSHSILSEL